MELFARELGVEDPAIEEDRNDPQAMFDDPSSFAVTYVYLPGDGDEIVLDVETIAERHGFEVSSGIGGGDHRVTATKDRVTVKVQVPRAAGTAIEIRIAAS